MSIIDKINKMRGKGLQEPEISQRLREEGFSPRQIDESMDQSNVKAAVGTYEDLSSPNIPPPNYPQMTEQFSQESTSLDPTFDPQFAEHPNQNQIDFEEQQIMPPSPGSNQNFQQPSQMDEQYPTGEIYGQEQQPQQPQQVQTGYNQNFPQYEYNYNQQFSTDTITELTEQIIEEKTQEMQKIITDLSKFKLESQGKIENIDNRLKKIESNIDKLQSAIIGKIGNYGQNITDLKNEMISTQESFSKIVNPLASGVQELRELTSQISRKTEEPKTKTAKKSKSKKSKDGFNDYLRN